MKERVYTGQINGEKFRYSMVVPGDMFNYEKVLADRDMALTFFNELVRRGIVVVTEEETSW